MPDIDVFPKAHVVTFKYYVGLIHFLDEDYEEVRLNPQGCKSLLN